MARSLVARGRVWKKGEGEGEGEGDGRRQAEREREREIDAHGKRDIGTDRQIQQGTY
jgi:hypothetical protein